MGIVESFKDAFDLASKVNNQDLYKAMIDLQQKVAEVTSENIELKQKVLQLEAVLKRRSTVAFRAPFCFAENDEVPLCPHCWESTEKAVHLMRPHVIRNSAEFSYSCTVCNSSYRAGYLPKGITPIPLPVPIKWKPYI